MNADKSRDGSNVVSRRKFTLLGGGALLAGLAGCLGGDDGGDGEGLNLDDSEGTTVIASMPALWDFCRQVAGEDDNAVQPVDIVPVGEHGHDWNPEPATVEEIDDTSGFVYMRDFAAWQDDAASQLEDDDGTVVIDASEGIEFFDSPAEDNDEHWWMDPVYAQDGVENIAEGLTEIDPDNETYYRENADAFKQELQALHEDIQDIVDRAQVTSLVVATHDSYQWWHGRYGLDIYSPVGTSPDDSATPRDVQEVQDVIQDEGIEHILYDVGEPAQLAETLSAETDAEVLPLTPVETQIDGAPELDTGIEMEPDWGYIDHFRNINLPTLEEALQAR